MNERTDCQTDGRGSLESVFKVICGAESTDEFPSSYQHLKPTK